VKSSPQIITSSKCSVIDNPGPQQTSPPGNNPFNETHEPQNQRRFAISTTQKVTQHSTCVGCAAKPMGMERFATIKTQDTAQQKPLCWLRGDESLSTYLPTNQFHVHTKSSAHQKLRLNMVKRNARATARCFPLKQLPAHAALTANAGITVPPDAHQELLLGTHSWCVNSVFGRLKWSQTLENVTPHSTL
jgi:hypothetical protein